MSPLSWQQLQGRILTLWSMDKIISFSINSQSTGKETEWWMHLRLSCGMKSTEVFYRFFSSLWKAAISNRLVFPWFEQLGRFAKVAQLWFWRIKEKHPILLNYYSSTKRKAEILLIYIFWPRNSILRVSLLPKIRWNYPNSDHASY